MRSLPLALVLSISMWAIIVQSVAVVRREAFEGVAPADLLAEFAALAPVLTAGVVP